MQINEENFKQFKKIEKDMKRIYIIFSPFIIPIGILFLILNLHLIIKNIYFFNKVVEIMAKFYIDKIITILFVLIVQSFFYMRHKMIKLGFIYDHREIVALKKDEIESELRKNKYYIFATLLLLRPLIF